MLDITMQHFVLCPAQVTSRANTQLCRIALFIDDTSLSSAARMELLAVEIAEWNANVAGTTGQLTARREAGLLPARTL